MAQSAKDYAREQLGTLDQSYLDKERQSAQNTYNTSVSNLENSFNNLMTQINSNRESAKKNFNIGKANVAENAYNVNRNNQVDLASRGVGNSGLKTLGEVGNRIETGRQYSDLANTYYDTMNDLDTTQNQSQAQLNIDRQIANNTLEKELADIATRQGEATNNYNMTLGQLAENVQSRWDNNANAQASLNQARQAANQAHQDAVNAAKDQIKQLNQQTFTNIVNNKDLTDDDRVAAIQSYFRVDRDTAINALLQLGIWGKGYTSTGNTNYDNTYDYISDIYNMR